MEEQRVTQQELESLKEIQTSYNQKIIEFGQLTIQIGELKHQLDSAREVENSLWKQMDELKVKEGKIAKELSDKYGVGNVNIETGIFSKNP